MRCVVTGGNGFIASHVVEALREAGHEAKVLDLNGSADFSADITDTNSLIKIFNQVRPHVVFHLAAIADARAALNNPVKAVQINIAGTASVFEAARQASVGRVVLASTCWVANAMGSGMLTEEADFKANGGGHVYTTTKIASEMLAHDFQALYGLNFTILRYGIPYGPRVWPGLVLRSWMEQASAGEPVTIFGDGSASRRFVYVGDLAQAHVLALQDVATNQIYNLEGMRAVTLKELAEVFQRLWGPVKIIYRPEPTRVGEFQYLRKIISNGKAFVELGWEPRVDLEEGIRRTIEWYRQEILQQKQAMAS
jgi:nucleoside-diphosphate-sugar epimerase